jgi:hypothetical protein
MKISRFSRLGNAASSFRKKRADYYDYLANIMPVVRGRQTIRDIFVNDAVRYGKKPRGILSAHWARQIDDAGGDLAKTFEGTLPKEDVGLIGSLQKVGADALEDGLKDIAAITRLSTNLVKTFKSTVLVAGIAFIVLIAMLFAVAYFTAPQLKDTFSTIPPEYYREHSRRLFGLAEWIRSNAVWVLLGVAAFIWLVAWSLPNWTGKTRRWFDKWGLYRVYRDINATRFLVTIAALTAPRGRQSINLPTAFATVYPFASPWLRSHIEQMNNNLNESTIGAGTFNTGLMDQETFYFFEDFAAAQGLTTALAKGRARLETQTVQSVAVRANVLRWILLLTAVASLFGIFFWHYAVIDEMTALMKLGIF